MPNRKRLIKEHIEAINRMHRSLQGQAGKILKKWNLSLPQAHTLHIIALRDSSNIKELSQAMNITSSAATQMVESLVRLGLLKRFSDRNDRRIVNVILTVKGQQSYKKFNDENLRFLEKIYRSLSDQELKSLVIIPNKISSEIENLKN